MAQVVKSIYIAQLPVPTSGRTQQPIIPDPRYPVPYYGLWRYLHSCVCAHLHKHIDNLKYEINLGLPSLLRVRTFWALVGSYSPLSAASVALLATPLSSTAHFLALELSDWITFAPQHHRTSDLFFPPSCGPPPGGFSLTVAKLVLLFRECTLRHRNP